MHSRLLVTINKENAINSSEARSFVYENLTNDESFCGEGGRFSNPIADWLVIGGRWSGYLSENTFMKSTIEKIQAMEKESDIQIRGCFYGNDDKKKIQAELKEKVEKLYKKSLPKEYQKVGLIFDRDQYLHEGYEDDAMLVNAELYDVFLKDLAGVDENLDWDSDKAQFVDLDYELVSEDFIGKKWLVVVDYHS